MLVERENQGKRSCGIQFKGFCAEPWSWPLTIGRNLQCRSGFHSPPVFLGGIPVRRQTLSCILTRNYHVLSHAYWSNNPNFSREQLALLMPVWTICRLNNLNWTNRNNSPGKVKRGAQASVDEALSSWNNETLPCSMHGLMGNSDETAIKAIGADKENCYANDG
jgi:hypothetical protein